MYEMDVLTARLGQKVAVRPAVVAQRGGRNQWQSRGGPMRVEGASRAVRKALSAPSRGLSSPRSPCRACPDRGRKPRAVRRKRESSA